MPTKVIFQDTFKNPLNKDIWNFNVWQPVDNPAHLGRTDMRQKLPDAGGGALHLQLDTYNPGGSHTTFLGSEAILKKPFGPPTATTGYAFEITGRFITPVKGLVGGLFTFSGNKDSHNEIDWEALSNDYAAGRNRIQTNVYANEPLGAGHVVFVPLNSPLTNNHLYRVEWVKNEVDWYVDGNTNASRTETVHVPNKAMQLHLNIWAPSGGWKAAYDASLQPAKTLGANKIYKFDVTSVKVLQITTATGKSGNDQLHGGKGEDRIDGRGGDDVLLGKSGKDHILGGAGDDRLQGHGGKDILEGGAGADSFVFETALKGKNVDQVLDFKPGLDKIEFDDAIFTGIGPAGALAGAAFHIGAAAGDADDRILYDSPTGKLSYDADGNGPADAVLVAKFDPSLALTAGDFLIS